MKKVNVFTKKICNNQDEWNLTRYSLNETLNLE